MATRASGSNVADGFGVFSDMVYPLIAVARSILPGNARMRPAGQHRQRSRA
jgi:hypothetical protein